MMKIIVNKYKKVVDFCYKLFKMGELGIYSSKFSKKTFTQFQHMFLLIYKQYRKFTYQELLEDIASNKGLRVYIGLCKLPHYTTLIKFAGRIPCKLMDEMILSFKKLIPDPKRVAIDATGISLDNASPHFCKRICRKVEVRPFMKVTFAIDIDNYLILLCKMRKKSRHDVIDARPLIKKLSKYYRPDILFADRGYDDNKIFKLCFEELGAYPLILQKNLEVPKHRRSGRYRKLTYDVFDYGQYLQRNRIESFMSMLKRRFNGNVKSWECKKQKMEIYMRVIAYNIDRLLRIGIEIIWIMVIRRRISY